MRTTSVRNSVTGSVSLRHCQLTRTGVNSKVRLASDLRLCSLVDDRRRNRLSLATPRQLILS